MGEFLDQTAKLSPELRERKGNAGITPDTYQILSPSSNHIYTPMAVLVDEEGKIASELAAGAPAVLALAAQVQDNAISA